MSRSGYSDDYDDNWTLIMWRGAVASAMRGKRGQAFLREMLAAMDALDSKELIADDLEKDGSVCAIGSVGKARGLDMSGIDPHDRASVAHAFGIAEAMAAEIVYENDEVLCWSADFRTVRPETPKERFVRMRSWIESRIKPS